MTSNSETGMTSNSETVMKCNNETVMTGNIEIVMTGNRHCDTMTTGKSNCGDTDCGDR